MGIIVAPTETATVPDSAARFAPSIPLRARYDNWIGGEYRAPVRGQYFTNLSPVTGKAMCEVARSTQEDVDRALDAAARHIISCPLCGFFQSAGRPCALCDAPDRDRSVVCVVEQPTDIVPLERTGAYHGLYHVLGGRLSPLDNVHPENLRIAELTRRLADGTIREVILAVGSDVEGEATAHYLADHLAPRATPDRPLAVTRLAQGLPAGGGLEHADDLTLHRALSGRRRV